MIKKLSLIFATALLVALMIPTIAFAGEGINLPPDPINDPGVKKEEMTIKAAGDAKSVYLNDTIIVYANLTNNIEDLRSASVEVTLASQFAGPTSEANSKWTCGVTPEIQHFDIATLKGAIAYSDETTLSKGNIFQIEIKGVAVTSSADITMKFIFKGEDDEIISAAQKTLSLEVVGKQGFIKEGNDWVFYEDGYKSTKTGAFNGTINGTQGIYYIKNGVYDSSFKDFARLNGAGSTYYYMVDGKAKTSLTSVVEGTIGRKSWWYIENGVFTKKTTIATNDFGKWYVVNGEVDFNYSGFVKENNDWLYFTKNKFDNTVSGIIKGTVNSKNSSWYVVGGKVSFITNVVTVSGEYYYVQSGEVTGEYTGFISYQSKYWYFENSKVDQTKSGIIKGKAPHDSNWNVEKGCVNTATKAVTYGSTTYYCESGEMKGTYNGFGKDSSGTWWYFKNSIAQTSTSGIIHGTIDAKESDWNVESGKFVKETKVVKYGDDRWYVQNGEMTGKFNGNAQDSDGVWWIFVNSKATGKASGFQYIDGAWWYLENNVKSTKTGAFYGTITGKGTDYFYVKSGKYDASFTGFALKGGSGSEYYYMQSGKFASTLTSVYQGTIAGKSGWYYVEKGVYTKKNVVASNAYGMWYAQNGQVTFNYKGFAADSDNNWWYFKDSKAQTDKTSIESGVVNGKSSWWYFEKGQVKFIETVAGNDYGWWYVKNGEVTFNYTGVADNSLGKWYCVNSKVGFNYKGFAKDKSGNWWYFVDSKAQTGKTSIESGVVNGKSSWWYFEKGQVKFIETVAGNDYGWWYVKNGEVTFNYTGVADNSLGKWYCVNSKVGFNYKGFAKDSSGNWWYFVSSKAQLDKTSIESGVVNGKSSWWYFEKGQVKFIETVAGNDYGWWYVKNGEVTFNYTGVADNSLGKWYCVNSKVGFNYKGFAKDSSGNWWYFVSSKAQLDKSSVESGVVNGKDGWWSFKNGKVDFSTHIATNQYGTWYVENGKVNFDYSGSKTIGGITYTIVKGKVTGQSPAKTSVELPVVKF